MDESGFIFKIIVFVVVPLVIVAALIFNREKDRSDLASRSGKSVNPTAEEYSADLPSEPQ